MPDLDLITIRRLRTDALSLLSHQASDLSAFLNKTDGLTFRRLPDQDSVKGDVKVTTTCSCLMSLMLNSQFHRIYRSDAAHSARQAFKSLFDASWQSSGLGLNNAFTTVLVLRTFGMLAENKIFEDDFGVTAKRQFAPLGKATLTQIANWLCSDLARFGINKYPVSAALIYWFLDGVDRAAIKIRGASVRALCEWARQEFYKQRSLVDAKHEALMDPIAMGMGACLCARLRKMCDKMRTPGLSSCLSLLPSSIEIDHSIEILFDLQGDSGIWPKYFPLFHYPDAGSNFCFTFEMLEAVLAEFGDSDSRLLGTPKILTRLERAMNWCVSNRLEYTVRKRTYSGWNSGGELGSLNARKPESWATAIVHMFLWELQHVLAVKTQSALLRTYKAPTQVLNPTLWDGMLDMEVQLQGSSSKTTVKTVLSDEIIKPATDFKAHSGNKLRGRLSALLFGPPGTSKTRLTHALAAKLGWPVIMIDPSQFLSKGIENIYSRATEIFRDLEDLAGAVVLFDEMDALVKTRDGQIIDLTAQFLTTSMLPKLATLHDQASLIFLFATNYQEEFDPAIKRPGRFDVLLCVGPPTWKEKVRCIDRFLPQGTTAGQASRVRKRLKSLCADLDEEHGRMLDLLTYQETPNFLRSLQLKGKSLAASIQSLTTRKLVKQLSEFSKYVTLRKGDETYSRYEKDFKESRLQ